MKKRLLLKISGEALRNNQSKIVDYDYCFELAKNIQKVSNLGYEIGIVIGGGNICRGRDNTMIAAATADNMGLLATSINSLLLKGIFDKLGIKSVICNAFDIDNILKKKSQRDILTKLNNKFIIIFGGGTGAGGCSTDTAAALKANLIKANYLIKLTNVDGVYDKDPDLDKNALKYDVISFENVINKKLKIVDEECVVLCQKNDIPIIIMNIKNIKNIEKAILDNKDCTLIK